MSTPLRPLPQDAPANLTTAPVAASAVNPDNPPFGIPGAVAVWLLSFVLMLVAQLAFLLGYAARRNVPLTAIGDFALKDPTAIFFEVVSIIPAHVLTLGLAWLLVTRLGKRPFLPTLGWEWDARFTFWRCAGLALALLLVGLGIIRLLGNPETALDRLIESSRATALATAFAATFTAPLIEEITYRGLLYSALQRVVGKTPAVAVVLLLFAAIHVPQYWPNLGVILTIILLSFTLTAIRAYTGKLLPCFIIHLIFNGIQAFLIVLNPYLERFSPEKSPAPGILHVIKLLTQNFF